MLMLRCAVEPDSGVRWRDEDYVVSGEQKEKAALWLMPSDGEEQLSSQAEDRLCGRIDGRRAQTGVSPCALSSSRW